MNDEDLRDLFAGMALQGLLADEGGSLLTNNGEKYVAEYCYILADAMLDAKYADDEPEPVPEPEMGITAIKPKRKAK
jgi:hypothetical protein